MKTPKQKRLRPGKAAKPAKKSGVKTQAAQSQGIASKSLKARPGKVRPTKLRPGKLKPTKRPGTKRPGKPTVIKGDLERVTPDTLREVLNGDGGKIRDRKTREILPKIELDRLRPGIGLPLPKPKGNGSLFETLSAKVPLTLFPVRLETVFDREGKRRTLKIRVYPDDIHIDDHDPRLSPEERDIGQTFWSRMAKAKGDEALQTQICTWLIDSLSEKRAAFVAEATRKGAEPPKINKASGRQPARARCLPKFWKAVGYRRKGDGTLEEVFSAKGHAIPKTLCVDPLLGEMDHATTPAGRTALWMSDFQAAVTVGMGIEVDVTDLSWLDRDGLAMLMVYGVRGTASLVQSSEMQHLMQAHRFSSGLAFQAQGVPTNSVEDTRSPVASHFAAPDGTLATVLSDPVQAPDTNAGRMARALGLDVASVLSRIEGAERDEDAGQAAMNEALWPVTWGQYFNTLMRSGSGSGSGSGKGKLTVSQAAIDVARARFLDDVRGAGPLPAIRVGSQPYGVLPVRAHHMPKAWANTDPWYEFLMLSLRNIWLEATPAVAKLSPGGETQAAPPPR